MKNTSERIKDRHWRGVTDSHCLDPAYVLGSFLLEADLQ